MLSHEGNDVRLQDPDLAVALSNEQSLNPSGASADSPVNYEMHTLPNNDAIGQHQGFNPSLDLDLDMDMDLEGE